MPSKWDYKAEAKRLQKQVDELQSRLRYNEEYRAQHSEGNLENVLAKNQDRNIAEQIPNIQLDGEEPYVLVEKDTWEYNAAFGRVLLMIRKKDGQWRESRRFGGFERHFYDIEFEYSIRIAYSDAREDYKEIFINRPHDFLERAGAILEDKKLTKVTPEQDLQNLKQDYEIFTSVISKSLDSTNLTVDQIIDSLDVKSKTKFKAIQKRLEDKEKAAKKKEDEERQKKEEGHWAEIQQQQMMKKIEVF